MTHTDVCSLCATCNGMRALYAPAIFHQGPLNFSKNIVSLVPHGAYRARMVHIAPSWCTSTPYTIVVVHNVAWVNPHTHTHTHTHTLYYHLCVCAFSLALNILFIFFLSCSKPAYFAHWKHVQSHGQSLECWSNLNQLRFDQQVSPRLVKS